MIASKYSWLESVANPPKMIIQAIALGKLNTNEVVGPGSNPVIMQLAKEADVTDIYKDDDMAWCALAMTVIALRAGKDVPFTKWDRLRAHSFIQFGSQVEEPMFGDVCVFSRPNGFHVAIYVGEDDECYHICGGNQGNQFDVIRIAKDRLLQARRPVYSTGQPESVKKIFLEATGNVSNDEA